MESHVIQSPTRVLCYILFTYIQHRLLGRHCSDLFHICKKCLCERSQVLFVLDVQLSGELLAVIGHAFVLYGHMLPNWSSFHRSVYIEPIWGELGTKRPTIHTKTAF